jgi:hypothetical protein
VSSFANEVRVCVLDEIEFGRQDEKKGGKRDTVLLPSTRNRPIE